MKNKLIIVLLIAWHLFIFINSSMPGDVSASQSGIAVNIIYPLLNKLGMGYNLSDVSFVVRKLAHFTEYFILGTLLYGFYINYAKKTRLCLFVFLHGVVVAILDEGLQTFVKGRSGDIKDVLIDTLGVLAAYLLITLGRHIYDNKNKTKTISTSNQ